MLYEQRPRAEPDAQTPTDQLWEPHIRGLRQPKDGGALVERIDQRPAVWRVAVAPGDRYAVVDELDSGFAVLVTSRWPVIDRLGGLVFDDDSEQEEGHVAEELRDQIDQWRGQLGQTRRPLRIGDVFLVRGDWDQGVVDISAAARERAKMALHSACTGPIAGPQRTDAAADPEPPTTELPLTTQQRPPGPTAAPVV
ncbi:MAG: hypothetical protein ACRD29_04965 [Acidimicrobiales bacterium]